MENLPVDDLELTIRSQNCLRNAGIVTVGDLVQHTERDLLCIYNFGRRSLNDVKDGLARNGFSLKAELPTNEKLRADLTKARAEIERLQQEISRLREPFGEKPIRYFGEVPF